MTAEQKQRRSARHEAQNQARKYANKAIGLYSTPNQVKAAARKLIDRTLSLNLRGR